LFVVFGQRGRYRVWCNPESGYWYAMRGSGKDRERVSLGVRTRPEAEAAVKALDAPPPPVEKRAPERLTWSEFQQRYLEFKSEQGKAARSVARFKAAMDAFGRYISKRSLEHVDEVTLTVLEGYVPYRTKTEKCGEKTAYTDALIIKNALKWGSKPSRGLLAVNPALDWETKEPVMPKRRTPGNEEVEKLEAGVRQWLRPIVTVLARAGLRIGELVNLRWRDVDFRQNVLHVRVQDEWKPKGRSDRTVPLHPKAQAALRSQPIGEYVFLGPRGGRLKETYVLECLKHDQEKLGLPQGDLHGFRRFFATTMMQAGVPVETVRQWGGWKSLETMLRYLADVDVRSSVAAMEQAVRRLAAS
jgi:integrase